MTVDVSGGSVITSEGRNGFGVYANHAKHRDAVDTDTTVDMTVGAGTQVRAPFGNGVYSQLSVDNVAGVAILHTGAIEARGSGILAWASLGSGIVLGDGSVLQLEDHTGNRQPVIHVVSSGDITVGAGVADAYIREAVTGADGTLPAAERAVLDAILAKGSDAPGTALAALPASYADSCKDGIRLRATFFNEGDIRVDVTGGTTVSDGDGVHARYVLTNDRNGAITVTVAEDARVSGERNGIYVGSAGTGEGGFRAQGVTVNGVVTGGTGAGVHMAGGGRLVVSKTGRIGATSGVGVLADRPGDFHATVSGTADGDIRSTGAGALTGVTERRQDRSAA